MLLAIGRTIFNSKFRTTHFHLSRVRKRSISQSSCFRVSLLDFTYRASERTLTSTKLLNKKQKERTQRPDAKETPPAPNTKTERRRGDSHDRRKVTADVPIARADPRSTERASERAFDQRRRPRVATSPRFNHRNIPCNVLIRDHPPASALRRRNKGQ